MKFDQANHPRGFALIATMAIMSLIVMIAVASISLSKSVSKESVSLGYKREAQSNARMALMIALGELQKELGPDQRVSANMGIFAGDPKSRSFQADQLDNGYENPNFLGVWDSWSTWLSGKSRFDEIKNTYDRGRSSNFRRLLVSHPDAAKLSSEQWRDFAEGGANQLDTVALVSNGSLGNQANQQQKVNVPLVKTESGRFAWYVSGNNQKANVALGKEERRSDLANNAAGLSNVTSNGLNSTLDASLGNYPIERQELNKVLSVSNAQLLANNAKFLKENFHAFTSNSKSVLANVRDGGLKKDINLLLELDDPAQQLPKAANLTPESNDKYKFAGLAYRGNQDDSYERNPRPIRKLEGYINDRVANTSDQLLSKHLPSWQKLANYYNEYKVSLNPEMAQWTFDQYGTSKLGITKAPRIAAAYIQLGLYTEGAGTNSQAWITYNPVLHIWNPYNTPIKIHPTWVATNFPCVFIRAFEKNTNKELFKWQRLMHYKKADSDRATTWHGEENGGLAVWANYQGMVLQPGEVKVMTTTARGLTNNSARAELSPGFNVGNDMDRGIRVRINPLNDTADGDSGFKLEGKDVRDYNLEVAFSNLHDGTSQNQLEFFLSSRPDKADSERVGSSGSDSRMHDSAIYVRSPFGDTITKYYKLTTGAGVNFGINNQFLTIGAVLKGNDAAMGSFDLVPSQYDNKSFVMSNPSNPIFVAGEHAMPKSGQNQYQLPQNVDNGYGDFHYNFAPKTTSMSKISQYNLFINNGIGSNNSINLDNSDNSRAKIFKPNSKTSVALVEIPTSPVYSLASFQSFPTDAGVYSAAPQTALNSQGLHRKNVTSNKQEPSLNSTPGMRSSSNVTYAIANSFAHPLIAPNKIYRDTYEFALEQSGFTHRNQHVNLHGAARYTYDHSFMLNDALFDEWFCSSITPQSSSAHFSQNRSIKQLIGDLATGDAVLPNQHLRFSNDVMDADTFSSELTSGSKPQQDAHKRAAQGLVLEGGFNVNSTSHLAWKALFNSLRGSSFQYRDPDNGRIKTQKVEDDKIVVSRFSLPLSANEGRNPSDHNAWQGVRYLTEEQIDKLAHECVRQVKLRGPFLNMADFVNRRLDTNDTELSRVGALQAAIDWDEFNGNSVSTSNKESINGRFKDEMIQSFSDREEFPDAHKGSKWTAIPGYVIQGDLLERIGNQLTVRDDTFTIRSYGEATDKRGRVQARAYCEAIVQRGINYVDDKDEAYKSFKELNSDDNELYGRKMKIVGFRWLNGDEI